jgi:CTP synthase (UTP-ammonia lyase)
MMHKTGKAGLNFVVSALKYMRPQKIPRTSVCLPQCVSSMMHNHACNLKHANMKHFFRKDFENGVFLVARSAKMS